jgi:D-alanyl-D-alanine carboxypeptidase
MRARQRLARRSLRRVAIVGLTAVLTVMAFAGPGHAETPTPTPSATPATPTASATPTPSASLTPTVAPPSSTPATSSATPTADPQRASTPQVEQAPGLTLAVRSTFGSGSAFWSDIGKYAFRGSASGLAYGAQVEIYWRSRSTGWTRLTTAQVASGAYAVDSPVLGHGTFTFAATSGGAPGSGDEVRSNLVTVTVGNSGVRFNKPVERIDALKNPQLTGSIVPGRAGVTVNIDVLTDRGFRRIDATKTNAKGHFALSFRHGHGRLVSYRIRAAYQVPNRPRWEASHSHRFWRVAVLNAVVTPTTAAEVATTYHSGCPVGRSRLSTITINHYGADSKMHRGVMIVRSDLASEIRFAFDRSLGVRFPITRMNNPNAYGGNDPKQMAADNSSGFNCRRVVGNPYRMSPHSYGIAIDVNPRQNPYRDVTGKWWPSNGKNFIDRTPRRGGMLDSKSTMVRTLSADGFFWGGRWYPGRDYQHFQY